MNLNFEHYVASNRLTAETKGVPWQVHPNAEGSLAANEIWNLSALCGSSRKPQYYLADLGMDNKCLAIINAHREQDHLQARPRTLLSPAWQEFIKAAVIDQVFIRQNQPIHIALNVIRPLRVLATCAEGAEPWELTLDDVIAAQNIALECQQSGGLARGVTATVRLIIDHEQLADRAPFLSRKAKTAVEMLLSQKKSRSSDLRQALQARKSAENLPGRRAFWELVRIAFTEIPKTFYDELRFAQLKLLTLCGLRIGEATLIPFKWRRAYHYYDAKGELAGTAGGISESIALHYFIEKRGISDQHGSLLYPGVQHVPAIFEEAVEGIMARVESLTAPLRKRITEQSLTGRIFPEYRPDELISAAEFYPRLSGNPFVYEDSRQAELIARYRDDYDNSVLDEIGRRQADLGRHGAKLKPEVGLYYSRIQTAERLPFRDANGVAYVTIRYEKAFFQVREMEQFLERNLPGKMSDLAMFRTTNGDLSSHELLFLSPKRSPNEGRNGGICDITRYMAVGFMSPKDLLTNLYDRHIESGTFFQRYSLTDEDRELTFKSHAFRHLQNTELFRLGIADTIITKRFGRRSLAQSYEYDHRSLLEELQSLEVPESVRETLDERVAEVFGLIASGKTSGRLVDEFKRLQREQGDQVAFEFLATEADGFHTTPYGFCINGFTVNPCPQHLECYNGCRHLTSSPLPAHQQNLVQLQDRFITAINLIEARPSSSTGRSNQLQHARTRLENITTILNSEPGGRPFPDGPDLFVSVNMKKDIFDE